MRRLWIGIVALAAAISCFDSSAPGGFARLTLSPLLDSLFVGDTQTPPLTVTYVSAGGDTQPVGQITWRSGDPDVATVDTAGRVVARGRGETIISATANGVTGRALLIVTRTLEVTLLLDTIYLMRGDTLTVPVEVRKKGGGAPAPWFDSSLVRAVFTIDSATGLVTANGNGGPIPFVVHADTVADTGAVHVVVLQDTTGGRSYFTIFGTVIRRQGGGARALNYRQRDGSQGFRLTAFVQVDGSTVENVVVALPDSVTAPGEFLVDSIGPDEAFGIGGADFTCQPRRSWGLWASIVFNPPINALSRVGGSLAVTQMDTVTGGLVVSGRFTFDAQRLDFYDDPGGLLPIRGTFVAPLVTNLNTCL